MLVCDEDVHRRHARSAVGFMGGNIRAMGYVLACTNRHYLAPIRGSVFKKIQVVTLIINYDKHDSCDT